MATFMAIIAPTPSAIKVSGDGNGARILLEVSETELGNAIEVLALRNVLLRVTIEPTEPHDHSMRQTNTT